MSLNRLLTLLLGAISVPAAASDALAVTLPWFGEVSLPQETASTLGMLLILLGCAVAGVLSFRAQSARAVLGPAATREPDAPATDAPEPKRPDARATAREEAGEDAQRRSAAAADEAPSDTPAHSPPALVLLTNDGSDQEEREPATAATDEASDADERTRVGAETALHCLVSVARQHGVELSVERLQHVHAIGEQAVTTTKLTRIARAEGLRARAATLTWSDISSLDDAYPVIVQLTNGNWVEVVGVTPDGDIGVRDPLATSPEPFIVPRSRFEALWRGTTLLVKAGRRLAGGAHKFGLGWFMPLFAREWRLFADVAVAAVVLYALALVMPVFFQLVIDKVLVHESYATLYVLAGGAAAALVFEAAFNFLRRFLLLYATNRTDIRVSTKTFSHLLSLPVSFFEQSSAGVLVKHMQQSSRIRDFLAGRLFLTLLDSLSLFVFLPLLLMYSVKLTLVVLAFTFAIALTVALLVSPYRRRLKKLYEVEAERQALLVETMHGMRTLKSLAMEPNQGRVWDDRSAESVSMRFRVERLSAAANAITGLLEKMMGLAIVGLGALAVFSGDMTIGALVAFNMLASRVSGPLVQMVTMMHEYQEVALSVKMLGEIMDRKSERDDASPGMQPELRGEIEFESVGFRYGEDGPPALDDVSFTIPEGSLFGLVGRSGSGKTTLTRLIQGLYPIQQGLVRIDGYDVRELDLVHLRRNIGVVLQDNFLFKGSVRDNISRARPGASMDEIAHAARLAGATEFIERLPRGFDTMLEENAANLSGGQRQRLAIARALITDPKILIFDEATSALDPESERIIRDNLRRIAQGRTVIIVSHRLSTLVDCSAILVVDRGRIADIGRHEQLLTRCTTYRHLWNQQMKFSA